MSRSQSAPIHRESPRSSARHNSQHQRNTNPAPRLHPLRMLASQALHTQEEAPRALVSSKRLRVLVVDDDPIALRGSVRALASCSVTAVSSAAQAACLLESDDSFDAIVSDYSMPCMSGVALLNWVNVRWPALARRFILLTGTRPSAVPCDAVLIIEKPVAAAELLLAVGSVARGGQNAALREPASARP